MKKVVGKRRGEILIKCALAAAVGLLLIMLVQSFPGKSGRSKCGRTRDHIVFQR